jgi:hypothetical protein
MFALKVIFEKNSCFFERVAGGEIITLSSSSLTRRQNKLERPSLLIISGLSNNFEYGCCCQSIECSTVVSNSQNKICKAKLSSLFQLDVSDGEKSFITPAK